MGILCGDQIIALRPVRVVSKDYAYAKREYAVTEAELEAFAKRSDQEIAKDRKVGRIRRFTGNLDASLRRLDDDANRQP